MNLEGGGKKTPAHQYTTKGLTSYLRFNLTGSE